MMASKARVFNDEQTLQLILKENSPHKIKRLGRTVQQFQKLTWDLVKYDIVVHGNHLKFEQNQNMKEILFSTGRHTIIAEASPLDSIWGIGISLKDATNGCEWKGENLLGKALMEVRDELLRC